MKLMMKRTLIIVVIAVSGWVLSPSGLADSVVVFNEIMYHPAEEGSTSEWVELHNQLALDVDISGWAITGGIEYLFPEGTVLPAEGFLVVACLPVGSLPSDRRAEYAGPVLWPIVQFRGDPDPAQQQRPDHGPGPVQGSGPVARGFRRIGLSLAKRHEDLAAGSWQLDVERTGPGGTPGRENFPNQSSLARSVVFNEVQPGDAGSFWCEILNVSERPFNLSGTFITGADDDRGVCVLPDVNLAPDAFYVVDAVSWIHTKGRRQAASLQTGRPVCGGRSVDSGPASGTLAGRRRAVASPTGRHAPGPKHGPISR